MSGDLPKLEIPRFLFRNTEDDLSDTLSLVLPNDRIWKIGVKITVDHIVFETGWNEFANYIISHNGTFVYLRYVGCSQFLVEIYGKRGSMIIQQFLIGGDHKLQYSREYMKIEKEKAVLLEFLIVSHGCNPRKKGKEYHKNKSRGVHFSLQFPLVSSSSNSQEMQSKNYSNASRQEMENEETSKAETKMDIGSEIGYVEEPRQSHLQLPQPSDEGHENSNVIVISEDSDNCSPNIISLEEKNKDEQKDRSFGCEEKQSLDLKMKQLIAENCFEKFKGSDDPGLENESGTNDNKRELNIPPRDLKMKNKGQSLDLKMKQLIAENRLEKFKGSNDPGLENDSGIKDNKRELNIPPRRRSLRLEFIQKCVREKKTAKPGIVPTCSGVIVISDDEVPCDAEGHAHGNNPPNTPENATLNCLEDENKWDTIQLKTLKKSKVCHFEDEDKWNAVYLKTENISATDWQKVTHYKMFISNRRCVTEKERKRTLQEAQSFSSKNPFFTVIMRPSHVYKWFSLHINNDFAAKYLSSNPPVVILHYARKNWYVKFSDGIHSKKFTCGWASFVWDNNIEEGDICVFELIDVKHLVLKVSIFRVIEQITPFRGRNKK